MRPISRTLDEAVGEPIASPWPEMDEFVEARRGDAILLLGAPMSNKSNLMLNWLIRAKVPTIYGTFDTPVIDMTARSLSILTGDPTAKVMDNINSYAEAAESNYHLWFTDDNTCLQPDRDGLTGLDDLAVAYEEFLGEPPQAIVFDNISDVAAEVHRVALQQAMKAARDVGRRLNCAVFIMHHVRRNQEESDPSVVPVRLDHGVEAGERDASTVLGLWKPRVGQGKALRVAHLKSKRMHCDPAGGAFKDFYLDQSRSWVGDEVRI